MGKIVIALLSFGCGILGYTAWTGHQAYLEAEALAKVAEEAKVAALARADSLEAEAAVRLARADSIQAIREVEQAVAARRAAALAARADELETAIMDLVPIELVGEQVREQVALRMGELRAGYETRLSDKNSIIRRHEQENTALRGKSANDDEIKASLRRSLAASEQETAIWRAAANPGFFGGLWKEKGPLSAALTLGVGIGAMIGG